MLSLQAEYVYYWMSPEVKTGYRASLSAERLLIGQTSLYFGVKIQTGTMGSTGNSYSRNMESLYNWVKSLCTLITTIVGILNLRKLSYETLENRRVSQILLQISHNPISTDKDLIIVRIYVRSWAYLRQWSWCTSLHLGLRFWIFHCDNQKLRHDFLC